MAHYKRLIAVPDTKIMSNIQIQLKRQKGADLMQLKKAEREQINAQSSRFSKRIGSTLYEVNVYFAEAGKESLEDKIFRLVSSDSLNAAPKSVKMGSLQTERLPERGSA
jgi:hypothetical protein